MDVSNILKNGLFQKISTPPPPWMALEKSWLSSGIFQEGEAKNFLRAPILNFLRQMIQEEGANFFKENEILTLE